jgi:hypothetical protein
MIKICSKKLKIQIIFLLKIKQSRGDSPNTPFWLLAWFEISIKAEKFSNEQHKILKWNFYDFYV